MVSYCNYKYVSIPDKRLAFLQYGSIALVFSYVLFGMILLNKGYLAYDNVVGSVRFRLDNMNTESNHPYCQGEGGAACVKWDQYDVRYPLSGETNSLFITTAVEQSYEERDNEDQIFTQVNKTNYRVAGIENFWLRVSHSVEAPQHHAADPQGGFAASEKSIQGTLLGQDGSVLLEFNAYRKEDIIPLSKLLEAAGVDLDSESDRVVRPMMGMGMGGMKKSTNSFNTFRDRGLVLFVTISYENYQDSFFGTTPARYSYRVSRVPEAEYNAAQVVYPPSSSLDPSRPYSPSASHTSRVVQSRAGIQLQLSQTGRLAMFSVNALLMCIAGGMGLLAVGATVVESLAFYVLPAKNEYAKAMVEVADVQSLTPQSKPKSS